MSSDRIVSPKHVLDAVMELQSRGSTPVLSELEALEPELLEYLLDKLTQLHHALVNTGISTKSVRRLYRQAESIALISMIALRHAYREFWEPSQPESPTDEPPPVT